MFVPLLFSIASVAGPGTPQALPPRPAVAKIAVKHAAKVSKPKPAAAPRQQTTDLSKECTKPVVTFHGCVFYMPGLVPQG